MSWIVFFILDHLLTDTGEVSDGFIINWVPNLYTITGHFSGPQRLPFKLRLKHIFSTVVSQSHCSPVKYSVTLNVDINAP